MALPAPYAPPWRRLGEDLVATLAWLWLKGRELWRRNGEGSLPTPAFWPRRGARLFWPLLLALSLLAGVGLTRQAWPSARPDVVPEAPVPSDPWARSAGVASPEPAAAASAAAGGATEAPANTALETELDASAAPGDAAAPLEEPSVAEEGDREAGAAASPIEPAPPLWSGEDPERWIEAISAEPASATLTLRLNSDFAGRAAEERQRWAERWRERAAERGYSHLRLLAASGRPLGREAQVGGGMILFEPVDGPAHPPDRTAP